MLPPSDIDAVSSPLPQWTFPPDVKYATKIFLVRKDSEVEIGKVCKKQQTIRDKEEETNHK